MSPRGAAHKPFCVPHFTRIVEIDCSAYAIPKTGAERRNSLAPRGRGTSNLIHCVFSTKDRKSSIPEEMLEKLWAYISGIADNHHIGTLAIGGISNHIHLLLAIPQTMTVASAINALKANSSRWMHEHYKDFDWQKGYGAFSVSPSQVRPVKEYIRSQAEHHAKHTFEDEFISLLQKCGLPYDPEHVFG